MNKKGNIEKNTVFQNKSNIEKVLKQNSEKI